MEAKDTYSTAMSFSIRDVPRTYVLRQQLRTEKILLQLFLTVLIDWF